MTRRLSPDIARVIRGLLAERQISVKDFSASIGLPNSTVDRWLKGGKMSTDALDPLAEGLGLTPDELVALALDRRHQDEERLRKTLSPAEQADLDAAIARTEGAGPADPAEGRRQGRATGS